MKSHQRRNQKSASTDVVSTLSKELPDELTTEQKQQVTDLFQQYTDTFSTGQYDMARTSLVEHTIDTGNNRLVRQVLCRYPIAHLEVIDNKVEEMVQHDIAEQASSSWAAHVVLVRKKDGSYQLRVDYRSLNNVTYKNLYPLPHIDTCLGSMDGATWFSALDLRSGYHNIPIREGVHNQTWLF